MIRIVVSVPLDAVDTLYESFYNQIVRGDNGMVAAYSSLVTIRLPNLSSTTGERNKASCPINYTLLEINPGRGFYQKITGKK